MNTFTQQGHIKLIESGSKDLYNKFYFKKIVLSIYYLEKKAFIKALEAHFQH